MFPLTRLRRKTITLTSAAASLFAWHTGTPRKQNRTPCGLYWYQYTVRKNHYHNPACMAPHDSAIAATAQNHYPNLSGCQSVCLAYWYYCANNTVLPAGYTGTSMPFVRTITTTPRVRCLTIPLSRLRHKTITPIPCIRLYLLLLWLRVENHYPILPLTLTLRKKLLNE